MSAGPLKLAPGVMVMVKYSNVGNAGRVGTIEYETKCGFMWEAGGHRIQDTSDGWMVRAAGEFVIEIELSDGAARRFLGGYGTFNARQLMPIAGPGIDTTEPVSVFSPSPFYDAEMGS